MTKDEANKAAKAALKLMPSGWAVYVWNNSGWQWCLGYDKGLISVYCDDRTHRYMAMAHMAHPFTGASECWGMSDYFDHPQKAVEDILERLHMKISALEHFTKTVREAAGYL